MAPFELSRILKVCSNRSVNPFLAGLPKLVDMSHRPLSLSLTGFYVPLLPKPQL
jgi:hypothetical protein